MGRVFPATVIGLSGFFAYLAAVVVLADRVAPFGWPVQAVYYVVAGVLWVVPAHFLLLWAGGKIGGSTGRGRS